MMSHDLLLMQLWQNEGLYLHMTPYGCIATGQDQGIIEVVQNTETVAKVTPCGPSQVWHTLSDWCVGLVPDPTGVRGEAVHGSIQGGPTLQLAQEAEPKVSPPHPSSCCTQFTPPLGCDALPPLSAPPTLSWLWRDSCFPVLDTASAPMSW